MGAARSKNRGQGLLRMEGGVYVPVVSYDEYWVFWVELDVCESGLLLLGHHLTTHLLVLVHTQVKHIHLI